MSLSQLMVTYAEIQNLVPYARNARTHSRRQIRQIADSIRTFGFTNPVLVNRSRMIIAGHGRVAAAKLLGITQVPTICLDNLSEDEIRAYILADNKLAEKAGWDHSILAIELQHLTSVDLEFDVSITGFEVGEVDLILQEAVAAEGQEEKEPVEIRSGPAVTQRGDVWLLGDHRLICGDALDESTYSVLMKGQKAHAVFADPPYNVKIDGNVCGKGKIHHREFAMAAGEMSESEFVDFLCSALASASAQQIPACPSAPPNVLALSIEAESGNPRAQLELGLACSLTKTLWALLRRDSPSKPREAARSPTGVS